MSALWTTLTGKVEKAEVLDPVVEAVASGVNGVLPRGPVKDALHGTWLGHPVHPLLVAVPIGFWTGASLLDVLGERTAARRLVAAGVLAAVPTAATGLADWSELGMARKPKRVGLVHALANTATVALYAASWLARRRGDHGKGAGLALAGAGGLMVGGYLGGHLAYSQAVGVNRNADATPGAEDWTDAAAEADVVEGTPLRVTVGGQPVAIVRAAGRLHAMGATCSHWGGPLDEGAVEDGCLVCPWHGSAFSLEDGSVARGPATFDQPGYDVRVADGRVQVRARG
jgi:nitrite reductase/ring-hydroxylating ferredoxin subunit/uncharacterized membrane protein